MGIVSACKKTFDAAKKDTRFTATLNPLNATKTAKCKAKAADLATHLETNLPDWKLATTKDQKIIDYFNTDAGKQAYVDIITGKTSPEKKTDDVTKIVDTVLDFKTYPTGKTGGTNADRKLSEFLTANKVTDTVTARTILKDELPATRKGVSNELGYNIAARYRLEKLIRDGIKQAEEKLAKDEADKKALLDSIADFAKGNKELADAMRKQLNEAKDPAALEQARKEIEAKLKAELEAEDKMAKKVGLEALKARLTVKGNQEAADGAIKAFVDGKMPHDAAVALIDGLIKFEQDEADKAKPCPEGQTKGADGKCVAPPPPAEAWYTPEQFYVQVAGGNGGGNAIFATTDTGIRTDDGDPAVPYHGSWLAAIALGFAAKPVGIGNRLDLLPTYGATLRYQRFAANQDGQYLGAFSIASLGLQGGARIRWHASDRTSLTAGVELLALAGLLYSGDVEKADAVNIGLKREGRAYVAEGEFAGQAAAQATLGFDYLFGSGYTDNPVGYLDIVFFGANYFRHKVDAENEPAGSSGITAGMSPWLLSGVTGIQAGVRL